MAVVNEDTSRQADWVPVFGRVREKRGSKPTGGGAGSERVRRGGSKERSRDGSGGQERKRGRNRRAEAAAMRGEWGVAITVAAAAIVEAVPGA